VTGEPFKKICKKFYNGICLKVEKNHVIWIQTRELSSQNCLQYVLKFSNVFPVGSSPFFRPAIKAITVCRVIAHSRIRNSQRRYAKLLN